MKYLILLLSGITLSFSAFSQLEKRTWLLGGSGNLYSYHEKVDATLTNYTTKFTNIDLSASVGYFFANKLVGGLRPDLLYEKGSSSGGGHTNQLRVAVGPFIRYYFLNEEKQFNLLADVTYQLGVNKLLTGSGQGKINVLSAMTGVEVFFNSSVGLELLVGYANRVITIDGDAGYSSHRKGFQTSIGFHFHLENY